MKVRYTAEYNARTEPFTTNLNRSRSNAERYISDVQFSSRQKEMFLEVFDKFLALQDEISGLGFIHVILESNVSYSNKQSMVSKKEVSPLISATLSQSTDCSGEGSFFVSGVVAQLMRSSYLHVMQQFAAAKRNKKFKIKNIESPDKFTVESGIGESLIKEIAAVPVWFPYNDRRT